MRQIVPDSELTKDGIDTGDFWTIYDPKNALYLMCEDKATNKPVTLFESEDNVVEFMNRYNVPNTMEPKYVPKRVLNG